MSNEINYDAGSILGKKYADVYAKYRTAADDSQPVSIIPQFFYWAWLKMLDRQILKTYKN